MKYTENKTRDFYICLILGILVGIVIIVIKTKGL